MYKNDFLINVLFAVLLLGSIPLFGQNGLSGIITDSETGEPLPGAHVVLDETNATTSNQDGFYSFKVMNGGEHSIRISFVGYASISRKIVFTGRKILNFELTPAILLRDEVVVTATRAGENSPTTYSNISRDQLEPVNLGQDLPFLIETSPSVVVTSDAGAGVGYTGIRIRGTDITRINVTVNGIPLNDPESHGVWFVNMPDFASSLENIQIQRGVGTSGNGAAAFGATINMQSTRLNAKPYGEISSSIGSYNTYKNSVRFGSGLLNEKWAIDGRLSKISSDGYIDRATSDLKSFYISGAYYGDKSMLKVNVFNGNEKTYQAWNGVPKVRLNDDLAGMLRYEEHYLYTYDETAAMINSDSRTYNLYTYENETDNYQQDHYQLLYSLEPAENWYINAALHYTRGRGYYEQYKEDEDFADYQLEDVIVGSDTIFSTNLVRQKWLENDFYGMTWAMQYDNHKQLQTTLGGSWNKYDGDHFGKVIWAQYASNGQINHEWYRNSGKKSDFNIYGKATWEFAANLRLFGDLQFRRINYQISGIHDDLRDLTQTHEYNFINPKAGLHYHINESSSAYASVAVANREPSRGNFRDADPGEVPKPERLIDYELGYTRQIRHLALEANVYYMDYDDQLVLTGEINNVGDPVMSNVPGSYRLGVELSGKWIVTDDLNWEANVTISKNKVKNFVSYVDDWDNGGQVRQDLGETDLSFSPAIVAGSVLRYELVKGFTVSLISNFVGKQYIDNTMADERSLDPYFVNDLLFDYTFSPAFMNQISLYVKLNNFLREEYESNAWVYRYYYMGEYWEMDGYFPQAPFNVLAGVTLKF
ncbi:MAG: TonB-dependent receptor [Bacteroidales bacterium]|nr:TonB-dependent receptor [Bacteroidales bacterium]